MFSVQSPSSFHQSSTQHNHQSDFTINPFDSILPLHDAILDFNGNKIFNDLDFINNLPKAVSPVTTTPLLTPQPHIPPTINIPAPEPRPSTSEGVVRKPLERSNTNTLSLKTLDGRRGSNQPKTKRQRRRHDEIERFYHCGFNGCTKSYGTLNHLNAHVIFQKHGPKRLPSEFKEIREYQRNRKKEELKLKKMFEDEATSVSVGGTSTNTPLTTPNDETLPALPSSAPPTQTSFSDNVQDINHDDLLIKLSESGGVGYGDVGVGVGVSELNGGDLGTGDMSTGDVGMPFSAPVTKTSFFGGEEVSNDDNDNGMDFSEAIERNLSTLTLPENLSEALSLMDRQSSSVSSEDETVSTVDNMMTPLPLSLSVDNNFMNMMNRK
ncbi:hypothetical protein E3P81_03813 [Wallemia ichthyophaga]|nr:hypothetical protein E3P97_03822 [Wallemia ichthyophaga]TIB28276.1 hypothetical protein E3P85_03759 [Wallemia ichthyophaga]TIB43878.1 hypothetical protein E3P82_03819 [Wallemia ichthyophaga]TIB46100.1 hypothetical protein E3P81_03813 [Wallemia ichthyophaga]TIB48420.1 hypothetical protein E3P80_03823 [Wallemia ichthyophaga]